MDYYLQIYGAYDSAIDNLFQAHNLLKQNQKNKNDIKFLGIFVFLCFLICHLFGSDETRPIKWLINVPFTANRNNNNN